MEKIIIAMAGDNYNAYSCTNHGVFLSRKDVDSGKCPYTTCSGIVSIIENIGELRDKFKSELHLNDTCKKDN